MSVSVQKSSQLKAIAILMMLCLHLFNRDYEGLFRPLLFMGKVPLSYYISLFSDACVPIFAFVSGYGLYYKYRSNKLTLSTINLHRLKKLYLNYWIVLLLFGVGMGLLLNLPGVPGNFIIFLGNFSGLFTTYNGAWWFFTTYVFFVLTCEFWFRRLESRRSPGIYFGLLLVFYVVAFYFRIYRSHIFSIPTLHWLHTELSLYFCTLFQFMLGAFALEYKWNTWVSNKWNRIGQKNLTGVTLITLLIVAHGLVPNFIVAPFTGLGFIFIFLQLRIGPRGNKILDYMAIHSTNLWLIHLFFITGPLKPVLYSLQWPPLIFLALVLMCLIASYPVLYLTQWSYKMLKLDAQR